ncbi:MazG-like nucleotide pyrophosphohydrolase family protein [Alicyclobacillus sacchari]|uniref:MazG-like nucleotide pyrophosphohydrolase family protein n=1 Tax=Alicyclobacillus sacchari TaxID=392010 RepID=A0A4R8LS12_9BACL|nr:MazG-like family protein [Alicyclobacillus sacchari]TDY49535.1 MazG-like nucleotide pyrophosphohydrolase family protein [Alicyclobacillus sacchari]GMA58611.1 nucleotide pyrophosphohydrolase [Alicyclobacillus sacchari]
MERKTISLPRLGRLTPTLESTMLKITEEVGELAQAIGKFRGLSGEQDRKPDEEVVRAIVSELLDVAQTATSMMFVIEDLYGIDMEAEMDKHIEKLKQKGYL